MSIQYALEKRGEILYAIGHGLETSLEEDKEISLDLIRACKQHACELLLVDDTDVTYTSSTLALYELAQFYNDSHFQRDIRKIAVIPNAKYKEDNSFYETVVRNRGLNLRVFYDTQKAEAWLAEDKYA